MAEFDYKDAARRLWMLLDDIDTLDDACCADDAAFRMHAREVQRKRFATLSGEEMDVLLAHVPGVSSSPAPSRSNGLLAEVGEYLMQTADDDEAGPAGVPVVPLPLPSARDWTEDYGHENGKYMNLCVGCGVAFNGHKRRVVCKLCAPKDGVALPLEDRDAPHR